MRYQPNRDYSSDDVVQTPLYLAEKLVQHFRPEGHILEPCRGQGNFYRYLPEGSDWCEIADGRDFMFWDKPVDWIITNPPWSKVRVFLNHSMKVANEIVFLMTVNHVWTKARIRDINEASFGIKEIVLIDMPKTFPQSGFQLGAIHISRDWHGSIKMTNFTGLFAEDQPKMSRRRSTTPVLSKTSRIRKQPSAFSMA